MGTFAKRHLLGGYFAIAFILAWTGSLLAGGTAFLRGEPLATNRLLLMFIAMLAGPSLAGILMTFLADGKKGLQQLYARMARWQVAGRWYAALLIFPLLILLVTLALGRAVSSELNPTFFASGILLGLLAGFFEEIGWTGFAFPKLQARYGILSAALLLGFIHGLWHFMADFLGNAPRFAGYWLPNFIGFILFVMALRVLIVWVYTNTQSLLLAQLMHSSSSGFLAVLVPVTIAPVYWVTFYVVYAVVLWLIAALVIAWHGTGLMQQPMKNKAV